MDVEDLYLREDGEKPYNIRHRAYHFSKDLVLFVKSASYDRIFISMFDQLLRSGTSIGANLVERRGWKQPERLEEL